MKNLISVCLFICLFSCQSGKDKVTETVQTQTFEKERNNFFNQMESAQNAAAIIQATGADFNGSLLSNPSTHTKYMEDTIKSAANLGIYLSDLNYCIAYNQSDHIKELFNAAIVLSKAIGVDKNVIAFLMTRYNENITQSDSVMNVVSELYEKSTIGLRTAAKERLLGVVIAAYQIETLHLALGIIETYPKEILAEDMRIQILIPLFKMVLEQQNSVETIYAFLRTLGNASDPDRTPNFFYYNQAFEELIAVYARLNVSDAIANNQGAELLNDAVVNELSQKVNAIRNKIMDPERIIGN